MSSTLVCNSQPSSPAKETRTSCSQRPAIWQDWDKFKAAAATLHQEATKLAEVAKGGDAQAIAAQFDVMGKNGCGGCHQSFRQKLE